MGRETTPPAARRQLEVEHITYNVGTRDMIDANLEGCLTSHRDALLDARNTAYPAGTPVCRSTRYGEGCGHPTKDHIGGEQVCCCCARRHNDPRHVRNCQQCATLSDCSSSGGAS